MAHDNFIDKKRRRINLRDVHIENVLPEHFGSSYPKFINLLERYYEWQNQYDATELLNHLFAARDITETDLTLLNFIEDELLLGGSYFEGSGDKRAAANFSSVLFRAKGSKYSIEWFFRSFFNLDPEVIYTKENVFLIADENNPSSLISKIGPSSLRYITNDKLYQTFAILVRAGIPVNEWKKLFKLFVHPAGMYLGGEVLLESVADLNLTSQGSGETTTLESPVITLAPSHEPVPEGITVTYTVGAGTSLNGAGATEQTYLYPGTYKWYLEHVSTVDDDFVVVPPQIETHTPSIEASSFATKGDRILSINSDPTGWEGFDITGPGIFRGTSIVSVVGGGTNTIQLSDGITSDLPALTAFTVTGGWEDLEVTVKTELGSTPPADVPGKVYDTPTSGSLSFQIANDFFLAAEGLETYRIHILDWCNAPVRNEVLDNLYGIADVHYIVSTTEVNEVGSVGTSINITGTNLPDGTIYYYLTDENTSSGINQVADANLTANPNDWDAAQPNAFGFNNRQPIVVSSNAASFTVYPKKDYITEGDQTFRVFLVGPASYSDYHNDANTVELLAYLQPPATGLDNLTPTQEESVQQGQLITIKDTSVYPQYAVSQNNITEGGSIVPTITVTNEHNPNGDYFYNQSTETLTSDGVLWEILDDLDGRITTTSGRIAFNAASQTPTLSATTVDGYYRGTQTSTIRITNHDVPAQISTNTFNMVDAAPSAAVITGPTAISEGASGSWTFTRKNTAPGTTYYWWVTGAEDADFSSVPRTGSRSTLTVGTTAASITAGGDTMIMTSTMDLTAVLDQLPPEGTQAFTVNVSDTVGGAAIATFDSSITDVVPVYEVLTSAGSYTEGSTVVIGLNVTNSVGENVDYAIEDDGTGRYSVAGGTFVWNGSSYANLNLPTTVLATEEETQTITITVTGQSTGIQDTVEFDLTDLVPTYGLTIASPVTEGNDITLDLSVTNSVGETVSWALTGDTQGRASASSGDFTAPTYDDVVVGTTENTGFVGPEVWTFTVTGDDSGQTAQQTVTVNEAGIVRTNVIDMVATTVTEGDGYSFTVTQTLQNTATYADFAYEITGDTRANVGSTTITAATFASNSGVVTISPTTTSSDVYEGPQTITISGTGTSDTFSLVDAATVYNAGSFNVSSIAEQGGVARFTLSGTNIPNGTLVPYTITGVQAADIDVALTGNITMGGSNSGFIDVTAVYDNVAIESETITLTAGGQSDTVDITDAVPTVTYTASTNTPVTEGFPIEYTIVATEVNGGSYEDVTVTITGTASNRVTAGNFAITAAEFTSGSGTVTKNYSVINNPVYQGDENVTLDAVGDTYGNSAPQQTVTITDQAAAINSVSGPTEINDGGATTLVDLGAQVNAAAQSGPAPGPDKAEVTFSWNSLSDGDFRFTDTSTGFGSSNLPITRTWLLAGSSSDYDIRFDLDGSSSALFSGTTGSWLDASGSHVWVSRDESLTQANGNVFGTLSIRDGTTLDLLDAITVTMTATYEQ